MADREARIEFKAETSEFQSQVKAANTTMAGLRSEMKLNETQFQNSGNKADYLEQKASLLESQLSANRDKQAALNAEIQVANSIYGADSREVANLERQLNYTRAQEEQLKTQLSSVNSELQANDTATGKLTSTIQRQESELAKLKDDYVEAVLAYGENSDEANELAGEISDLSKELGENRDALGRAEDAANELDQSFDNAGEGADGLGGKFDALKVAAGNLIADGLQAIANSAKDLVADTIDVGKTFEDSMAKVQALSGATGDDLSLLRTKAQELGAATTFSSSEAADALGYMALAGWDANQSADALGGVLNLAASSEMDLGNAADMVTDNLSAFGLSAEQSSYFADLLAYAQANANTTAEGLGEAYKNCAANMNAAGQDVETTTALLSMMANQGLKGSEAGTALSAVMRDLTAHMEDGKIAIGDTAVEVMDANGNYRDMTDILADVEGAVGGMGDAERASALQSTFTSDSIKGLNLILNAGVGEAASFEEQLRSSTGTAEEMSGVMTDTLSGDLQDLEGSIEVVQLALYDKLEPALRAGTEALSGLVDVIGWAVDNGETIISVLGGMAAGVGAYVAYTTALKVMEGGWMALSVVQKASAAAQWLVNAAMSANPIGVVIGLITALVAGVVLLWNTNEDFRNAVTPIWEGFKSVVGGVVDWFTSVALPAIQAFIASAIQFFQDLWTAVQPVWDGIMSAAGAVVEWFTSVALPAIQSFIASATQFFQDLWTAVQPIWEAIRAVVETVISAIVAFVTTYLQALFTFWSTVFQGIWTVITTVWNAISTVVTTTINVIYTVVTTVVNAISAVWNAIWTTIWNVVSTIWNGIYNTVSTVINAVHSVVSSVINAISATVSAVFNAVWGFVSNIWNGIRNTISTAINGASTVVSGVVNAIRSTVSSVFSAVSSTVSNIWNGIKNAIGTAINGAKTVVGNVANGISSTVSNVFNGVRNTVSNIWNGIKNAIMTPINAAKDAVSGAINTIKNIINGAHLELPHFKLPHFNIDGGEVPWGIGGQGRAPTISIDWYAHGGILTSPTIFGWNGNSLLGGGEAGAEAVLPIEVLQTYIDAAFQRNLGAGGLDRVVAAIERLDSGLGRKIAENAPDSYPGDRSFRTALRKVGVDV